MQSQSSKKMELINRQGLVNQLDLWRNQQVVKVITGVRRSGKSTLLTLFQQHLQRLGIDCEHFISVNFESIESEPLQEYHRLCQYVTERMTDQQTYYIFFDEIQQVPEFERAIDSLQLLPNADLYVTGSNAHLLSGEIATLLSGRYVEIHVLPLSLSEMVEATHISAERCYNQYITTSSLPYALSLPTNEAVRMYLQNIYNTIVIKDVMTRGHLQDADMLDRVVRYLADNVGNLTSVKSIADTITSSGRSITPHTVDNYVKLLTESYLFYRVPRYDTKGKEILRTGQKYYLSDLGIRNMLLGIRGGDLGRLLENAIYLHLIRNGEKVMIGKCGTSEIDFVRFRNGMPEYYQVALSVRDEATLKRELSAFKSLQDNYPKYLLTLDPDPEISHDGIRQLYAIDWLLEQ